MSEFFSKILRIANIFLIFCTFASYLSPYVSVQVTPFFAVFGLFYPVFLLFNLLFFLFWLWRKKTYCLYSLGCILMGWTHLTGLMGFNLAQPLPEEPLTVVSYNTHSFTTLFPRKTDNTAAQEAFAEGLEKKIGTVEVLCLQEFNANKKTVARIKELLNLPHFAGHKNRGTSIFSKYPLIETGEIKFKNSENSCFWADMEIDDQRVRFYSVHLESVKISGQARELRREGDLRNRSTWSEIKSILTKYKNSTSTRIKQSEELTAHIAACPHPVVLCGDFNDSPVSYVYKQVSKGFVDNFKAAGRGWGATYAGSIPMLRIDYIFTKPKDFTIYDHGILKEPYSDHYPVYSQLKMK